MATRKRQVLFLSLAIFLMAYVMLHLLSRLFFLRTEIKWVLDDGVTRRVITKSDISTLPYELNALLNDTNMTGWLYGYTTLFGRKVYQGCYCNGRLEGVVSNWYHNGVVKSVDCFSNNIHVGESLMFYSNGQTQQCVRYVAGEVQAYRSWYDNGMRKSESEKHANGEEHKLIWNHNGMVLEDCWMDSNKQATSGVICVSWDGRKDSEPIILDVTGNTNVLLHALW